MVLIKIQKSILLTLAYYQIFDHPLTVNEIHRRIDLKDVELEVIEKNVSNLVKQGVVEEHQNYYCLGNKLEAINKRIEGEERARRLMKKARFFSSLIYSFPFVRAVFISGSLSKGSVPKDADIDYFIITKKHRLWIARTSLVMFKRIFLLNSKKYFCTNYFIDEETLEIPDKNIFTATEVSTLIPMRGVRYYVRFLDANAWFREFYPNQKISPTLSHQNSLIKKMSEGLIEPLYVSALAEKLDKYFMKKTYRRWMKMYGKNYTDKEFELAFRSKRGTSKNHDKNYQKKVLHIVNENIEMAMNRMNKEVING